MGQYISKLLSNIQWGSKKLTILMLGLDGAGKTTLLYKLKLGEKLDMVPTMGYNVESIQYRNVSFTVWDFGMQQRTRPMLKHYFSMAQGLIFVVDSNDVNRLAAARDELQRLLGEAELERVKVLVFANKQDLPGAASVAEVTEKLGLASMRGRQSWFVQGCCSTTGEGLHEGLDWLATALRDARTAPSIVAPSVHKVESRRETGMLLHFAVKCVHSEHESHHGVDIECSLLSWNRRIVVNANMVSFILSVAVENHCCK